tara:strand:+ start:671 stop:841 length:171 start_codon:yes stop_codon:yes gene_type:complete
MRPLHLRIKGMRKTIQLHIKEPLNLYNKNIRKPTDSIPAPQNKKRFNLAAGVLMKR